MNQPRGPSDNNNNNHNNNISQSPPHFLSGVIEPPPPSRRRSSSTTTTTPTLYHPSIFRYTCTGKLSLDSRWGGTTATTTTTTGNSKTTKPKHRASPSGVCHGIQSQLEHVDHWRVSTREEAIQTFQMKSAMDYYGDDDDDANDNRASTTDGKRSAPLPPSLGVPSPTNGGSTTAQALQPVYLSNVLVYPVVPSSSDNNDDNDDDDKNSTNKRRQMITSSSTVPAHQEEWSCYGSTEVDLLVLRPQNSKDETIAAVAPYCSPGVTVRDLSTASSTTTAAATTTSSSSFPSGGQRERTRTIRLGILEIVYSTAIMDEEEEDGVVNQPVNDTSNGNNKGKTKRNDNKGGEERDPASTSSRPPSSLTSFPTRVFHSSKNVWKHMQINGQTLYESFQDDYPKRTIEAGTKIYHELGKTWDRTYRMMKKIASPILGFGGDNDDHNNGGGAGPSSSGPPPRRR